MPTHSSTAIVTEMLRTYGLEYSRAQVNQWVQLLSLDPDNIALVEEQIRQSPEFAERFPGIAARVSNGYNAISVTEYLQLEDGFRQTMRLTGMPETFYDSPDDFAEFIANDVSVNELESRVAQGFLAARQAPDEVKQALTEFYGIGNSEAALAAYYLDPERALPAIQRQFEAAQISGTAAQTGFSQLNRDQAERLQQLGIDEAAARQGFSDLTRQEQLLSSNLGRGQDFTTQEQIQAQFEGNAAIRERIRRQREHRTAEFAGTTSGGLTRQGVVGLQQTDQV